MSRANMAKLLGGAFFVAFIAALLIFGSSAAVRAMGVASLTTSVLRAVGRSVPVGIEGRVTPAKP